MSQRSPTREGGSDAERSAVAGYLEGSLIRWLFVASSTFFVSEFRV